VRLDSVIVRFGGEIGIKGEWTRRAYEKLLLVNIKKTLKHHKVIYEEIIREWGRFYIKTGMAVETAQKLTRVFGISSVSPAIETSSRMEEILRKGVEIARETFPAKTSFAVRCRRTGKHAYSSMDICRKLGERILTSLKDKNLRVNLKTPEQVINVEVRGERAFLFSQTLIGVGGFPLGSQPKLIGLLSGGIDSPVACWLVMKRGCPVTPVYFDNVPYTDEVTTKKAMETAKILFEWAIGFPRKIYIVPNGENLKTFMEKSPKALTCILCKRMMYRIAERITEKEGAEGIVTGESIGEQASQTLQNLRVLDSAITGYPVHRPLIGFNKQEIVDLAKKIGVYEVSTQKAKGCTAAPAKPATKAELEKVEEAERRLDIQKMMEKALVKVEVLDL
jgi:thiamine biosynthesis protein ThiI